MRKPVVAILFTLAACGAKVSPGPDAVDHRPGAKAHPDECCCVSGGASRMAFDGSGECAVTRGSTCTDNWTSPCLGQASQQEVTDDQAAAQAH